MKSIEKTKFRNSTCISYKIFRWQDKIPQPPALTPILVLIACTQRNTTPYVVVSGVELTSDTFTLSWEYHYSGIRLVGLCGCGTVIQCSSIKEGCRGPEHCIWYHWSRTCSGSFDHIYATPTTHHSPLIADTMETPWKRGVRNCHTYMYRKW